MLTFKQENKRYSSKSITTKTLVSRHLTLFPFSFAVLSRRCSSRRSSIRGSWSTWGRPTARGGPTPGGKHTAPPDGGRYCPPPAREQPGNSPPASPPQAPSRPNCRDRFDIWEGREILFWLSLQRFSWMHFNNFIFSPSRDSPPCLNVKKMCWFDLCLYIGLYLYRSLHFFSGTHAIYIMLGSDTIV